MQNRLSRQGRRYAVLFAIFASALFAQPRRAPQSADLYQLVTLSDPHWSPRGLVFVATTSSEDQQRDLSHLWWLGSGESTPRQLTHGNHSNYQPQVFPDGDRIAFLSDRGEDGKTGLYVLDLRGGEARPLVESADEVAEYALSRDGTRAALVLTHAPQADQLTAMEKAEATVKDEDVLVIDRADFKYDGVGFLQGRREHLWIADLATGKLRQLTGGEFDVEAPAFSADGSEVFFHANMNEAGVTYNSDLFAVPADSGSLRRLTTNPALDGNVSVSPDGQWLAYLAAERPRCYYDHLRLWTMRPDGSQQRCLTPSLDRSISFEVLQAPVWSTDGKTLYVLVEDQASIRLAAVSVQSGQLRYLTDPGLMVHGFATDGRNATMVRTDLAHPTELYRLDPQRGEPRAVTHFNDTWLNSVQLARIEPFRFESAPKIYVEGWIFLPAAADPGKKLPAILRIHGGPQWFYGSDFFLDFHVYAMAGHALFFCNPRGSTTYGAAFSDAIRGDWGNVDYHDLMAATDYVLRRFPELDSTRLGLMGWSYGGIMTAWITAHANRFNAAVCGAPVVDYVAEYGETDTHIDADYEFFGPPWEQAERYRRCSPITYVANVHTPTLLAHGDEDYRCAVANSERWFIALKRLGVETVFLRYPGESHLFARPAHNVHFDREVLKWFDRFLVGTSHR